MDILKCVFIIGSLMCVILILGSCALKDANNINDPYSLYYNPAEISNGVLIRDAEWTNADETYIIVGDLLVKEGVTLTVGPDVTVALYGGAPELTVEGTLVAVGTRYQPITFTGIDDGDACINIRSSSGDSILRYCAMTNAALAINADGMIISQNKIRHLIIGGDYSAIVWSNKIGLIECYGTAAPIVDRCTFNRAQGLYSPVTGYSDYINISVRDESRPTFQRCNIMGYSTTEVSEGHYAAVNTGSGIVPMFQCYWRTNDWGFIVTNLVYTAPYIQVSVGSVESNEITEAYPEW